MAKVKEIKNILKSSTHRKIFIYISISSLLLGSLMAFTAYSFFIASEKSFFIYGSISILLSIVVLLIFSHLIAKIITEPIKKLIEVTGEIEKGSLDQRLNIQDQDEMGELARSFNKMTEKLEEYYKDMDEKVKTQQKHLLNILNDSADGIISLDENDRIVTWNRGAELIYGYKASEIVGKPLEMLLPENLKEEGELDKIRNILKRDGFIRHYETERTTKEGRKIIVDITRTAIKDSKGQIIGCSSIIKDITERKEFEKRLTQTEKLTTMGQIATNIAHEIKNPLMGISGSVQVLMKRFKSYPTTKETLSKIFEQVQRLDSTLKGLLSFSRPQTPYFLKSPINEIIDQVLFFIAPQAKNNQIEILKDLSNDIPPVSLDPDQIKQVFLNIILNAVQAMPEGGQLKIATRNDNGERKKSVTVAINDTGPGISEDYKNEIFKPFFTTKVKGTGLGLVISKNIVKEHGGTINFISDINSGSTFEINLPIEQ